MKYSYTIFYVENVEETIKFYGKAFGFQKKFISPELDYGEVISGDTTLSFASIELGKSNLKKGFIESTLLNNPFGIEIVFTTENIEEDFDKAKIAGAVELESIVEKPWGQKVGYLRDNNGFLIEISTPIKK